MSSADLIAKIREIAAHGAANRVSYCEQILNEIDLHFREITLAEKPKTRRVRVGVIVNSGGDYFAIGWNNSDGSEVRRGLMSDCDMDACGATVSWIEADVPRPAETTVDGAATAEETTA
jgi:hypothetical protein